MQNIQLARSYPEKERWFEPSDEVDLFDVYQRTFDKEVMYYSTVFIGTFPKKDAIEAIKLENDISKFVTSDLRAVKDQVDINLPPEKLNISFDPIIDESANKLVKEEIKEEIRKNPLDWTFPFKPDEQNDSITSKPTRKKPIRSIFSGLL